MRKIQPFLIISGMAEFLVFLLLQFLFVQGAADFFSGDFYKAERCHIHKGGLDRVLCKKVFELVQEFPGVFLLFLVDKIYNDNTGQIAQADLACRFSGCLKIYFQGPFLTVFFRCVLS